MSRENNLALGHANQLRTRHGLAPLSANRRLERAAQVHACEMARRGQMTHRDSRGGGPADRVKAAGYAPRITAENIAAGHFDLNRTLQEWARSPGHRANLLLPGIHEFGIAYAVSADGKARFWSAVYAGQ